MRVKICELNTYLKDLQLKHNREMILKVDSFLLL